MKNSWKELILAFVLAWGMPWVIMAAAEVAFSKEEPMPELHTQPVQTQPVETQPDGQQTIQVLNDGILEELPLTDYLTGVLISEMPGSFHMEAKMAQAVVARTYALRRLGGTDKHPGAVCTDSSCCQGYLDPESFSDRETAALARQAVKATEGMVLTYEGELIDATYFSCSGGTTEDAVAVWGSNVPYLQSVESPGEEMATHYTDTVHFTKGQLETALDIKLGAGNWTGSMTYTEGGGVASVMIGGKLFRGTELRSLLGLRSTAFTVKTEDGGITFTTKGYGHRVGMSQYGAQAMALKGSDYAKILQHYYQGTILTRWAEQ